MAAEQPVAVRQAREAADAVEKRWRVLESRINRAKAEAAAAAEREFQGEKDALRAELTAARRALVAAQDQTPPHEWEGRRVYCAYNAGPSWDRKPVRKDGIVETRRSDTRFPDNTAYYAMPQIGEGFVRLLKADGKPGLRFERFDRGGHPWKLVEES